MLFGALWPEKEVQATVTKWLCVVCMCVCVCVCVAAAKEAGFMSPAVDRQWLGTVIRNITITLFVVKEELPHLGQEGGGVYVGGGREGKKNFVLVIRREG